MMIKHRSQLNKIINIEDPAAEIGVAEGFFSRDMLAWGLTKLYMVDAWQTIGEKGDGASPQSWHDKNMQDAIKRVAPFGDKAVILRGLSVKMAELVPNESLGLVYLDAGHDYENVIADLKEWFPKLKKGGVMAGHDYYSDSYGVKRAVHEFTKDKYELYIIEEHKRDDAGFYFIKT